MRKILFFCVLLFCVSIWAQDVIVKKDGSPILAKVLEVNTDNVKYKKHTNQKGPTYTIAISDILSLTYANGDKEDFGNVIHESEVKEAAKTEPQKETEVSQQGLVELPADARNVEIIRQYSTIYQPTDKIVPSNSMATRCFIFCGVKSNSIMSNDELEMEFEAKNVRDYAMAGIMCRRYLIKLTNKTDNVIYIDKGNCFRTSSDGNSYTYYEPSEQMTVTKGGGLGAGLNAGAVAGALGIGGIAGQLAGGLNVGGGQQHSTSTTYNQQRFLAIPPHSSRYLTEDKFVKTKGGIAERYAIVERSERFLFATLPTEQIGIRKGMLRNGEVRTFGENDLPWERKYLLTYSTREDFATYSCLRCDLYIKEAIGSKMPKNTTTKMGRFEYGEEVVFYSQGKVEPKCYKYISGLGTFGIVGLTMFDGADRSGTGTIIGTGKK